MTTVRQVGLSVHAAWDKTFGRLLVGVLVSVIRMYQRFISPLLGPTCKYYPSCSAYAVEALRTHGAIKGSLLTVGRLARCNPWSHGGIDFVPERGQWKGQHEVRPSSSRVGSL